MSSVVTVGPLNKRHLGDTNRPSCILYGAESGPYREVLFIWRVSLSEVSGYFVSGAGDGRNVRLDVENKTPEQILSEFASVAGIPE